MYGYGHVLRGEAAVAGKPCSESPTSSHRLTEGDVRKGKGELFAFRQAAHFRVRRRQVAPLSAMAW